MQRPNVDGSILRMATLLLLMAALTACSPTQTVLQGNQAVQLRQSESAPFSGWLMQPEALARILEKAERCSK